MSGNIAVIYTDNLGPVAEAFGEAAAHLAARVRLLRVAPTEPTAADPAYHQPTLGDLEWADGIAFGTPIGDGNPNPTPMRFLEGTEPLWSSGRLYGKVVTVFTDEPEHMPPDSVLHPIYHALYGWGAVIVGPKSFELDLLARSGDSVPEGHSTLSVPRLGATQHRGYRLARLASMLAEDRARRERVEL